MCRLLGYLGSPLQLNHLLYKPEHSLIVQSYQPREMESAILNADGFGMGWYHPQKEVDPYIYKNTMPIWNDLNLPEISRYVESDCVVGYIRSATPGLAVDLSNCQPFKDERILFTHNGYIENFRTTLYRTIRKDLNNYSYELIKGTTDSEHLFALMINELQTSSDLTLKEAVTQTISKLHQLANHYSVYCSANLLVSDGEQLIATRYSTRSPAPSLYWLRDDPNYPDSVIIASEPLFQGNWNAVSEQTIISVGKDLEVYSHSLDKSGDL